MINHISESIEDSWYRGEPNVLLKITAISPSSALRSTREVADVLIAKYGSIEQIPPALIMYSDRGPEHGTTFLIIKIEIIALQKFLNLDYILVARTAPGHSYRNPVEKINCILNLGLYGIGIMRKPSIDHEFEHKLNCKLVHKSPEKNLKLLDESCKPCTQLIKDQFSCLQLKWVPFWVPEEASHRDIDELFKSLNLDKSIAPFDCVGDLRIRPKLTQCLTHCCRQRTYFFPVKKCESQNCEVCLAPPSSV